MNRLASFILITVVFYSCLSENKEETILTDSYPQKWELISITNSLNNKSFSGQDILLQEYYILNSDRTFSKIRKNSNSTVVANGTFKSFFMSDKKYLYFKYINDSPILVNCTKEFSENVQFDSELYFHNNSFGCDNPILIYKRTE